MKSRIVIRQAWIPKQMIKLKKLYPLDSLIEAQDFHAMPAVIIVQRRFQGPALSERTTM